MGNPKTGFWGFPVEGVSITDVGPSPNSLSSQELLMNDLPGEEVESSTLGGFPYF